MLRHIFAEAAGPVLHQCFVGGAQPVVVFVQVAEAVQVYAEYCIHIYWVAAGVHAH